jgi:hypothetical protein
MVRRPRGGSREWVRFGIRSGRYDSRVITTYTGGDDAAGVRASAAVVSQTQELSGRTVMTPLIGVP